MQSPIFNKRSIFLLLVALCFGHSSLSADEGHKHQDDHNEEMMQQHQNHMDSQEHAHNGKMKHHRHDNWPDPPEDYADKQFHGWTDIDAISRGEKIYQSQCVSCHGEDGQGMGVAASSLSHAPADLTWHYHVEPGNGDSYLFWRVSEGGLVEPFKSQNSAMPAFKSVLTEEQRWDVLAYVHTFFHLGLANWTGSEQ